VAPLATTLPELAGRIRVAMATVTLDLLNNVWTEIEYKYGNCLATHGALIEYMLNVSHKNAIYIYIYIYSVNILYDEPFLSYFP
jgi:hypothetical protein